MGIYSLNARQIKKVNKMKNADFDPKVGAYLSMPTSTSGGNPRVRQGSKEVELTMKEAFSL